MRLVAAMHGLFCLNRVPVPALSLLLKCESDTRSFLVDVLLLKLASHTADEEWIDIGFQYDRSPLSFCLFLLDCLSLIAISPEDP